MSFTYSFRGFSLGVAKVIENGKIMGSITGVPASSLAYKLWNDTPGNLLTGFGFYEPYWLIDFANACIVLHLAMFPNYVRYIDHKNCNALPVLQFSLGTVRGLEFLASDYILPCGTWNSGGGEM
ncbi:hypothetical protein SO802_024401 [Lithocarpus litseifolius]|uniref:Uncharacterized protein n=1 Tax=Lithocarpus litseifolius TaxID=425828 RepID=A0AAW2CB43_9ROSI